jgi:SAM-dependent methyltransferase
MLNMRLLTSKVAQLVKSEGFASSCCRAWAHLWRQREVDLFDIENGTETAGIEPLWKLSIRSPNAKFGERYQATTEHELSAALESLALRREHSTFIDLGCGKGRTLLVASRLGFAKVIGVEFAQELADVAWRNVAAVGANNATVVHADAAEFSFPSDENLVVYMYNPFSQEVLARVIEHLPRRRELHVIYKMPRCAELLDGSGFLERQPRPQRASHIAVWRATSQTEQG